MAISNDRAAKVSKDPRFRRAKKKDAKVKIDSRFASMMTDSLFEGSEAGSKRVDKYGRKKDISTRKSIDLKRFYRLEEDDDEKKEAENDKIIPKANEDDDLDLSEVSDADMDHERMAMIARGELVLSSEEDEDNEDNDVQLNDGIFKLDHGELEIVDEEDFEDVLDTEDVPKGEPSKRFAVVNMDWENIKALDIFKVMEAFKPATGSVLSVRIYPSEFGKERIAHEDRHGPPPEIFQDPSIKGDIMDKDLNNGDADDEDLNIEALRKYQLERLRYYYAVVECDSVRTASSIFDQCDGSEYERSSVFFDLRYIPDEMDFDGDEVKDEATEVPVTYQPREFVTHVLQHSNPKLTWDEDDPVRLKVTKHKFTKDDLKSMDFQTYLASGSEASDSENEDALRKKYKSILQNAEGNAYGNYDKDMDGEDGNMEITFTPGLSSNINKLLDKKKTEDEYKDETVFETMMRKRKEKRKELRKQHELDQDDSDGNHSDLENDPFFREELLKRAKEDGDDSKSKSKTDKRKGKHSERPEADPELDLLLMNDEVDEDGAIVNNGKQHFDYDEITKAQKKKGKKSKKLDQADALREDDFKIDTRDPRFDALFSSSQFALDPTNSKFRKTEAMATILDERKKRNRRNSIQVEDLEPATASQTPASDRDQEKLQLKNLVNRIKMRK